MHEGEDFVLIIKSFETFEKFVKLIRNDDDKDLAELTEKLKTSAEELKNAVQSQV